MAIKEALASTKKIQRRDGRASVATKPDQPEGVPAGSSKEPGPAQNRQESDLLG